MTSKISPQQIIPDQFNNFNPASYSITYPSDLIHTSLDLQN